MGWRTRTKKGAGRKTGPIALWTRELIAEPFPGEAERVVKLSDVLAFNAETGERVTRGTMSLEAFLIPVPPEFYSETDKDGEPTTLAKEASRIRGQIAGEVKNAQAAGSKVAAKFNSRIQDDNPKNADNVVWGVVRTA